MKQIIAVLILLLYSIGTAAQNNQPTSFSLAAKWAPLSLIDPNAPTLQPGFSLVWKQRWGVHAEYGVHFNPINLIRDSRKGWMTTRRFRSELRYYPSRPYRKDPYGTFFTAAEGFFVDQNYRRFSGRMVLPPGGQELLFDTARVHRKVEGIGVKGGYEVYLGKSKKFLLEASGGGGLRRVTIRHTEINNIEQQPGDIISGLINAFRIRANDEWEGKKIKPHLSFTIRIGYRIL